MKDSGVEWLGEVPEHWSILPLRKVIKYIKTGGTPSGADDKFYDTNGFLWFTPSDFNDDVFIKTSSRQLSELGKTKVTIFPKGAVLMIGIGGTMGKVSLCQEECSSNQQINAIICKDSINNIYLTYYLKAKKTYIFDTAKYTTMPILNQEESKGIILSVPPLSEQLIIIDYLDNITTKIDTAITKTQQEIELLTEYKISLISSVVTGKVDVRSVEVPDFEM